MTTTFSDEEIRTAFVEFDLDKNSYIGVGEIRKILEVIGEQATDEEIDEMIRMADTDGIGQVTFEGFYKLFRRDPLPAGADLPKSPAAATTSNNNNNLPGSLDSSSVPQLDLNNRLIHSMSAIPVKSTKALHDCLVEFSNQTPFRPSYIKRVYKKATDISTPEKKLSFEKFLDALEVDDSELLHTIFNHLDFDYNGFIDVKDLTINLSNHSTATRLEKLKFAFLLLDENSKNSLSSDQLFKLLRANLSYLPISELKMRVQDAIDLSGGDKSGNDRSMISYENFMMISKTNPSLLFPVALIS
jgi:Ca2+-binding EF-hand superfamily protein